LKEKDSVELIQVTELNESNSLLHAKASSIQEAPQQAQEKPEEQTSFLDQLKQIPWNMDLILFLIVIFVCGWCMGFVATFLFIFIKDTLNGTQLIMGISVLVTCCFEIPVFYYSKELLDRVSPDWTITISLFAYVLRFGLYWSFARFLVNPWFILIPEILHGFTFALMWCSAVAKITKSVSNLNITNFAIGFISSVLTFGNVSGSITGGIMLRQGIPMSWIWEGGACLVSVVTFVWCLKSFLIVCGEDPEEKPVLPEENTNVNINVDTKESVDTTVDTKENNVELVVELVP